MRVKPMPVIGLSHRIPGPVRFLGIDKDYPGFGELLVGVAPDIKIAQGRPGLCLARALKPWVLIGSMVDNEFGDDPQIAAVSLADKRLEVGHPPIGRVDVLVVRDVVPVVAQRRGIERQQPQRGDAEILQIVELAAQPLEVADAVVIGVEKGLDVQLIDDRVLEPQRVRGRGANQRGAERPRSRDIVGWAHLVSLRCRRKISAGLVAGSSRNCWRGPRQVATFRPNASSSENI